MNFPENDESISDSTVVNIELKSGNVTDEAIRKQLLQNRYYLATLGKTAFYYTYISRDGRFLRSSSFGTKDTRVTNLFRGLSSAKREIAIIVKDNLEVFDRLLGVLQR